MEATHREDRASAAALIRQLALVPMHYRLTYESETPVPFLRFADVKEARDDVSTPRSL